MYNSQADVHVFGIDRGWTSKSLLEDTQYTVFQCKVVNAITFANYIA